MNKKILTIGSIIAAIILVLVTFTSVVGYEAVESSGLRTSPLFEVRTSRAIDEETRGYTCDYVGKGNIWSFPRRDSYQAVQLQRIIDRMRMMDDESTRELIDEIEQKMKEDNHVGNSGNNLNSGQWLTCACTIRYGDPIIECLVEWFFFILEVICFFTERITGYTI